MQKKVTALAAVLALGTSAAFATTFTLTGNYSITETYNHANGGPAIANYLSDPFSINLTPGTETSFMNFFTAAPADQCMGGGCSGVTETDPLTAGFTNLDISGVGSFADLSDGGTFTAKYSGSELPCAIGDGRSPSSGATDCVVWSGASNTYNGSTMLSELGNGYDLKIFLNNATDWNITPQLAFELVPASVPEPGTASLLLAGILAVGFVTRRRWAT